LDEILTKDTSLAQKIDVIHGSKLNVYTRNQLAIRNWSDVLPDVDFAVINKNCRKVVAILSCKTSLRERLTETAFWSRELKPRGIDVIFITTDKDGEITAEVNRYIVMHVLDYTIITDSQRYNEIINEWRRSYGNKPDFNIKIKRVLKFADIVLLLQQYATKCEG
jgi:type II restriction enzyme